MGQGFSTSTNVFVHLHKTSFFPGEIVTGSIHLNAVEEVDMKGMVLKVYSSVPSL
jgi:hypothetical protein